MSLFQYSSVLDLVTDISNGVKSYVPIGEIQSIELTNIAHTDPSYITAKVKRSSGFYFFSKYPKTLSWSESEFAQIWFRYNIPAMNVYINIDQIGDITAWDLLEDIAIANPGGPEETQILALNAKANEMMKTGWQPIWIGPTEP